MKRLTLAAVAAVLIGAAPQSAQAFHLSFIEGLLSDIGVSVDLPEIDIDLPPRAEEAVSNALSRAESVLDRINLPNLDIPVVDIPDISVPELNLPDVDQIVQDALDRANAARANARERAQSAIDNALGRAQNFLGDLDLPQITVPSIDLPNLDSILNDGLQTARDVLDGINLELPTIPQIDQIVDDVLNEARGVLDGINIDIPDVQSIVDDALGRAEGALDGVLDDVNGTDVGQIIEDAFDRVPSEVGGVIEQVLDGVLDRDPLNDVLNNLPEDLIPSSVFTTLETIFNRVDGVTVSQQAAVSVPEPTSGVLLMLAAGLGMGRRRR